MREKIILVFKTHFDYGFTDLSEKVAQQYAGPMLRDVIDTCKQTAHMGQQKFVWTMAAWSLTDMLERAAEPLKTQLIEMILQGSVAWHGLPFTSHTDFSSIPEMLQGLGYSRALAQRFGMPPPKTAKMTDVPGHGRILPSLLYGAGIRFLHLGCNEFARSPQVPMFFKWQGPDGAQLLTMYERSGYGSSLLPPKDWPFPVWLAFLHTHDNIGPQNPQTIQDTVAEIQWQRPNAEVVTGTMEDFYAAIAQCDLSHLPVVDKDLADSWIHGVGSYPQEVRQVRDARRHMAFVDLYQALTQQPAQPQLRHGVYDHLVTFSEHTWGLDVKTWMGPDRVYDKDLFLQARQSPAYRYMEQSWQEQRHRAKAAVSLSGAAAEGLKQSDGKQVLNPHAIPYTGWVEAPQQTPHSLDVFGSPKVFAPQLDPLSISPLAIEPGFQPPLQVRHSQQLCWVENHRYRLLFDKDTGHIWQVFDKQLDMPLLQGTKDMGVFSYRYDRIGKEKVDRYLVDYCDTYTDWGIADNGRENYPPTSSQSFAPVFSGYVVEEHRLILTYGGTGWQAYGDAKEIELIINLPPAGEEFFVELRLGEKQATPFVEAGSLVLPLPWQQPGYRINKNGYELDPMGDIAAGANHVFYCLEAYAKAEQEGRGVCVVAHDTPLMAIGENGVYSYRPAPRPNPAQLYFNLFNNMWGTNFPQWIEGDFSYRYSIFGYQDSQQAAAKAFALYDPPRPVQHPAVSCPLTIPEQMRVIYFMPYQQDYLLQLADISGQGRAVSFSSPEFQMVRTDLLGDTEGEGAVQSLQFNLSPYEIVSLRLCKMP